MTPDLSYRTTIIIAWREKTEGKNKREEDKKYVMYIYIYTYVRMSQLYQNVTYNCAAAEFVRVRTYIIHFILNRSRINPRLLFSCYLTMDRNVYGDSTIFFLNTLHLVFENQASLLRETLHSSININSIYVEKQSIAIQARQQKVLLLYYYCALLVVLTVVLITNNPSIH